MEQEIEELKEELCFYSYCWNEQLNKYDQLEKLYKELLKEVEHLRHLCKLFNIKDLNK